MENKQICLIFFLVSIIFSSFGGAQEVNLSDELELNILSAAIINLSNSISDVEKTLDSNKRLDQEKTSLGDFYQIKIAFIGILFLLSIEYIRYLGFFVTSYVNQRSLEKYLKILKHNVSAQRNELKKTPFQISTFPLISPPSTDSLIFGLKPTFLTQTLVDTLSERMLKVKEKIEEINILHKIALENVLLNSQKVNRIMVILRNGGYHNELLEERLPSLEKALKANLNRLKLETVLMILVGIFLVLVLLWVVFW